MSKRFLVWATAVTCGGLFLASLLAGLKAGPAPAAQGPQGKDAPGQGGFGQTEVWAIHLEIPAEEYEAMQPAGGGFGFPGGPKGPAQPKGKKDQRDRERNLFGTEFPWAQGALTADGKTYQKVGVRYAGDVTYLASAGRLKRPLKV